MSKSKSSRIRENERAAEHQVLQLFQDNFDELSLEELEELLDEVESIFIILNENPEVFLLDIEETSFILDSEEED